VSEELGLDAMDAGGLLEGFDDVGEKALFDFEAIGGAAAVADEEVADDALALLVDKE
jgi:hypothetical protein